jgi:hypothetical protein
MMHGSSKRNRRSNNGDEKPIMLDPVVLGHGVPGLDSSGSACVIASA